MKKLDFNPAKSKDDFHKNYKLHDIAEYHGKNLLTQWGITFNEFGQDKRNESVWEKGKDKPDLLISINNKRTFLDWKGKHRSKWLVNKRAVEAYKVWNLKYNIPVIIVFFVFNDAWNILEKKIALLGYHTFTSSGKKQWDKNQTVEFPKDIPEFSKANLFQLLFPTSNSIKK